MFSSTAFVALAGISSATATVLWDGRANEYKSSAFLNDWSFSNTVGPYQYYIHGEGPVTDYVNLSPDYKNPADSGSNQGIQITIDDTAVWNSDNMLRTELIPQTTAAINKGKVFYHFSMQHAATNPPSAYEEHQVCFFESHFTEMKYGLISGEAGTLDESLRWDVNGESEWNVTFTAGVWHNIAYAIDFDAGTVGFYHSTGADDLKLVVAPISASTSSNGADWHLGVLRLPSSSGRTDTAAEDWHFSGVYIESGDLTTGVSGPGGSKPVSSSVLSTVAAHSSTVVVSTTAKAPTSSVQVQPVTTSHSTTSPLAAPSSTAPASPSKASSSKFSTVTPTTLKTAIKSTSSTSTKLASISSHTSAVSPSAATSSIPVIATTSTASLATAPPTSSAVSPVQTSGMVGSPQPSHTHHPAHTSPTSTYVVAPTSTAGSDDECEVEYVYV